MGPQKSIDGLLASFWKNAYKCTEELDSGSKSNDVDIVIHQTCLCAVVRIRR